MMFRYVPSDMIRRSDFRSNWQAMSPEQKKRIERQIGRLIAENPSYRLPISAGPAYFMMHYLMSDLYTALSIYRIEREDGIDPGDILSRLDESIVRAGRKVNRRVRRIMRLPGAFALARALFPTMIGIADGHGFRVKAADCGKNEIAFDVTECPYCNLFARYDARALGPIFCRFDDIAGGGLSGIEFIREGTLCRGHEKCDFRYVKKQSRRFDPESDQRPNRQPGSGGCGSKGCGDRLKRS